MNKGYGKKNNLVHQVGSWREVDIIIQKTHLLRNRYISPKSKTIKMKTRPGEGKVPRERLAVQEIRWQGQGRLHDAI